VDEQVLLADDIILLCSDGLTHTVTDPEIASALATYAPASAAANRLIEIANENGGDDNITVIVIRNAREQAGFFSRFRSR
jgi:protein phosphatase